MFEFIKNWFKWNDHSFTLIPNKKNHTYSVANPKGNILSYNEKFSGNNNIPCYGPLELIEKGYADFENRTLMPVFFPNLDTAKSYVDEYRKRNGLKTLKDHEDWVRHNKKMSY